MKRLFIDIPVLMAADSETQSIECEYMFHRVNKGPLNLLEVAEFASYCRQCQEAFCVIACPKEALERLDTGTIKRYNMRCVGCKSCILACPFGTIFPEVMNYLTTKCDFCLNQLHDDPDYTPVCVKTAPAEAFRMMDLEENPKEFIYFVGEHMAVRSPSWLQKEGKR